MISYNVGPPSYKLVNKSPMNTIVISTINHSEIGVMCTNLAIVNGGPTLYDILSCIGTSISKTTGISWDLPAPWHDFSWDSPAADARGSGRQFIIASGYD